MAVCALGEEDNFEVAAGNGLSDLITRLRTIGVFYMTREDQSTKDLQHCHLLT